MTADNQQAEEFTCERCGGEGEIGFRAVWVHCPDCHGWGVLHIEPKRGHPILRAPSQAKEPRSSHDR